MSYKPPKKASTILFPIPFCTVSFKLALVNVEHDQWLLWMTQGRESSEGNFGTITNPFKHGHKLVVTGLDAKSYLQ